jgi:spore maturation protein CgeB
MKIDTILFVSLGVQNHLKDALSEYAKVIYWDWTPNKRTFNRDLMRLYDKHKPNLIFLQIQTPGVISVEAAKYLKEAFVINWTGDVRSPLPRWYIDIGRHIDLTLFSNMPDVYEARRWGVNSDYLQIGLEHRTFVSTGEVRKEADIIFMGNNVGHFPLSSYRVQMVTRLAKKYSNFKCYGTNWPKYSYEPQQLEEAKIYRGAKIGINLSHFNYERYSSDRIHRLMGCGVMCLSHYYEGIEKEYEIGKHLDVWGSFEELEQKIDYYMSHEDERKQIAKAGCEHVHANHTWMNRIKQLSEMIS